MAAATVSTKGQVVIPADVRSEMGLCAGTRIEFVRTDEGWLIKPANVDIRTLRGIIPKPKRPVSVESMNRAIRRHASR